jgi:ATP-binding cassette subfamily B (MDR/TAP) protein 1
MIGIGLVMWIFAWAQITCWSTFAMRIAHKIRIVYFRKCLEKDAAFYDVNNPTEMSAKISKEISAIQRGLGEKIGTIIMSIWTFIFGFLFAFLWGWMLTCILLCAFPFLIGCGMGMAIALSSGMVEQMRAYAQSAGYAE